MAWGPRSLCLTWPGVLKHPSRGSPRHPLTSMGTGTLLGTLRVEPHLSHGWAESRGRLRSPDTTFSASHGTHTAIDVVHASGQI